MPKKNIFIFGLGLFSTIYFIFVPTNLNISKVEASTNHLKYYGYFHVHDPSFGFYMQDVNGYANVVHLWRPEYVKVAGELGMKSILQLGLDANENNWDSALLKNKNQLENDNSLDDLLAILVVDEPAISNGTGWTNDLLKKAIAKTKEYFPDKLTAVVFNVPEITPPDNLDWIMIDPYFAPTDNTSNQGCAQKDRYDAVVTNNSLLSWAKSFHKPIILIGESFMRTYPKEGFPLMPSPCQQNWYYETAKSNPEIIGLLWFMYGNANGPEYITGTNAFPDIINLHTTIGKEILCSNTGEKNPVCGNDNNEYINPDQAKCHGTTIKNYGTCDSSNNSLMSYWKFDENSGNLAFNSARKHDDIVINGARWVQGKSGQALQFDGNDDYINVLSIDNNIFSYKNFTVSAWINIKNVIPGYQAVYWEGNPAVLSAFSISNGKISIAMWNNAVWTSLESNTVLLANQWYHIVATLDSNIFKIYINGNLDNYVLGQNGAGSTVVAINIGRNPGYPSQAGNFFNGIIDEIKIYNKSLTAIEIKQEYFLNSCGNGICDLNETITNCSTDCKSSICTSIWQCTSWGSCTNSQQTRICTDQNSCGVTTNKPIELQSCTPVCSPNWQIGSWSTCTNNQQTRTVTDLNNCGITTNKPATSQSCTITCATSCANKQCGDDGCGGSCGSCAGNNTCNTDGQCISQGGGGGGGGDGDGTTTTPATTKTPTVPTTPLTQMTREQLMAEINRIITLIAQLQIQLAQLRRTTLQPFTTYLYYGMKDNLEVKRLQDFLISKAYLTKDLSDGTYNLSTAIALFNYQKSKGISPANGFHFGPKSREAVNTDMGVK